jgi:hypothetical protein
MIEALNMWQGGAQQDAIDRLSEAAGAGHMPAIVLTLWFLAQLGQAAAAAPLIKQALAAGIVLPGLWSLPHLLANPETVDTGMEVVRASSDTGAQPDPVGYWPTLWGQGLQDAAATLFELVALPQPRGLRAEWERLLSEARNGASEIQSAATTVGSEREEAILSITAHEVALTQERERVQRLVEETTSLVHGVTAAHIAKAYSDRAKTALKAANWWTAAAIAVGIVGAGWAAFVAFHAFHENQGVSTAIGKTLVSIPILIVAGYLAGIAGSNRRMGWHWSHVELQIRTAEPFIATLDEETRDRLLAALAIRFFPGQGQDPQQGGGSSESLDVGSLISGILHELRPAAAPTSGQQSQGG